jgi:hypothetical protein
MTGQANQPQQEPALDSMMHMNGGTLLLDSVYSDREGSP